VLTELDSPRSLADAIRRALESPTLRDELVEQGLERARSRNWDDVAAETLEVYHRAAHTT